jgi:hypothetical protein
MPGSPCRSEPLRRTAEDEDARLDRIFHALQRRAVRTAVAQDRIDLQHARLTQRFYSQRTRQAHASAVMRAIGDLRGQLAAIAAHVGLSPWSPKAHSASAPGRAKRRRRSRRKMTLPDACKELPPFEPSRGVR